MDEQQNVHSMEFVVKTVDKVVCLQCGLTSNSNDIFGIKSDVYN